MLIKLYHQHFHDLFIYVFLLGNLFGFREEVVRLWQNFNESSDSFQKAKQWYYLCTFEDLIKLLPIINSIVILHDHFTEWLVIERFSLLENILLHFFHFHKFSQFSYVFRNLYNDFTLFHLDVLSALLIIVIFLVLI